MKFSQYLEEDDPSKRVAKNPVVIFVGGFYPFHKGHKEQFNKIKKAFPKFKKIIMTTTPKDARLPLSFEQKKDIIASYGIQEKNILNGAGYNMYSFGKMLSHPKLKEHDVVIIAVGQKDADRFKGRKVDIVKDESEVKNHINKLFIIPESPKISGTAIRNALKNNDDKFLNEHLSKEAINILKNINE